MAIGGPLLNPVVNPAIQGEPLQNPAKLISDNTYLIIDHLYGIESNFRNKILDTIPAGSVVYTEYIFSQQVKEQYPNLDLRFTAYNAIIGKHVFDAIDYVNTATHVDMPITNFVCSFNRARQPLKEWVLAKLHQLGWLNTDYCSKHFALADTIDGMQVDPEFRDAIYKINYNACNWDHKHHIPVLVPLIQQNFINIVSETQAHTYHPFWTEKFIYPIAAKTLWVASAAAGYHKFIEQYLGFRLYKTFDYSFDTITDHYERHRAMIKMLEPFSKLSTSEWEEIRNAEHETIEYNYNWLKSRQVIDHLAKFDEFDLMIPGLVPGDHEWHSLFGFPANPNAYKYWTQIKDPKFEGVNNR